MTRPRRICVFTGSRADYGLLYWIMRDLQDHPAVDLQVIVGGMHTSPAFGATWRTVSEDGFSIDAKIEAVLDADTAGATSVSMGLALIRSTDALERLSPDMLLVLGDRTEVFAVAQAAAILGIPIAHLHGGERSEGAVDELLRHAITKLSQLHFTAAEPYRRRVIQMGEQPDRVFTVGAPGIDNLLRLPLLAASELSVELGTRLTTPWFLVTYHPETRRMTGAAEDAMTALLTALDRFPDVCVLFTKANNDAGGRAINTAIDEYAADRPDRVGAFTSLGQIRYLSAMKAASVVIGNSSSGVIEAPAAGVPSVNIGDRQKGRLRAPSVIDCAESADAIEDAIRRALSDSFQNLAAECATPYGSGDASGKIVAHLVSVPLEGLRHKPFYDLNAGNQFDGARFRCS